MSRELPRESRAGDAEASRAHVAPGRPPARAAGLQAVGDAAWRATLVAGRAAADGASTERAAGAGSATIQQANAASMGPTRARRTATSGLVTPHVVRYLQRHAGNGAVLGVLATVQRGGPDADTVDAAVVEREATADRLRPAIRAVLTAVSTGAVTDVDTELPAAVERVLGDADQEATDRADTTASEIAMLEETVTVPVHGPITYDVTGALVTLDSLYSLGAAGVEGVSVSAGTRQVIRTMADHAATAIVEAMPGTPSLSALYVDNVQHDLADTVGALHDSTRLLRLELEGTISELIEHRRDFATAADEGERAAAGTAIGESARRALLLDAALRAATGPDAPPAPTDLDAAVQARADEIARVAETARSEDTTREELGNDLALLTERSVSMRHGETPDAPVEPMGEQEAAESVVRPEEAMPVATDTAEREMADELATRVAAQRTEVERLRGQVVPEDPSYEVDEFVGVHRRWFGMYSLAQEQQDPTVRLVLDLMGEPYRLMGADVGSASLAVEGGIARAVLMDLGVNLMAGSLHGETAQFGERVEGSRPRRRTAVGGEADDVEYDYGEMYPTRDANEPGRAGEVRSRTDFAGQQQSDTANAATVLAALPAPLRAAEARRSGLVTGEGDVPLVGVRPVTPQEGWTYLTDVRDPTGDAVVAREQKTVPPEVVAYLLAARQQAATLASTHAPTTDRRRIGGAGMRTGGVESATGTAEERFVEGESSPGTPSEIRAMNTQLGAARDETGVRPDGPAPDAERMAAQLQADLRAYLNAYFAERQTAEYRLAAIFALAHTEHAIGAQIDNLLEPGTLAAMVGEAIKISAIVMSLEAFGPLGSVAARAYQAHLSAQGVSNIAAVISVAAFCRSAAGADGIDRARAWGYMARNVVADAAELFENLVTSPVTSGIHALTTTRPSSPAALADGLGPLMSDPVAREALMSDLDGRIADLEAASPDRSDPELDGLRGFRDSLLGRSTAETAGAANAELPGARAEHDPAAFFTTERARSASDVAALHSALGADLSAVPVVESATLSGNAVHVRYGDDGGVRVEVGPTAEPAHVRRHAETVRQLRRFEGVMGALRRLLSRVRQALTGHPAYGTAGFEANLEVQKLQGILAELQALHVGVEARADRMTGRESDLAREGQAIRQDIEAISAQLAHYETKLDSYDSGRGFIAAEDTTPAMTAARERARDLRVRADAAAPGVRAVLQTAAAAHGGTLSGLEFELKTEDSLTRKIHDRAAEKGPVTDARLDDAATKLNDVLRYTAVLSAETYMAGGSAIRAALEAGGYTFVRQGNAWAEPGRFGGGYRGINQTYRTPDGLMFELQLHTPESLALKQETHVLYEERRNPATSGARKREIDEEMRRRAGGLSVPEGADVAPPPRRGGSR